MVMSSAEIKELAEKHWRYSEKIVKACGRVVTELDHVLYVESFIHGFKHGKEYLVKK